MLFYQSHPPCYCARLPVPIAMSTDTPSDTSAEGKIQLNQRTHDAIIQGVTTKLQEAAKPTEISPGPSTGEYGLVHTASGVQVAPRGVYPAQYTKAIRRGWHRAQKWVSKLLTRCSRPQALFSTNCSDYKDHGGPKLRAEGLLASNSTGYNNQANGWQGAAGTQYVPRVASVTAYQPRLADLMAYQSLIAKVRAKFKWPSWVVYDQNFRQDAVGNLQLAWAKVDPSTYAQCFTNQVISRENWCEKCQSLDHTSGNCPSRPRKRPWSAMMPQDQPGSNDDICKKYNRFNSDCKFGKECRYLHMCLKCREPHPISRCKANSTGGSSTGSSSRSPV